jgi:NAD(P)H dehydrogenase (quinone)
MLSLSTGGPRETYMRGGHNGDIMGILRPIHRGMLAFIGFDVLAPHIVYGPIRQSDAERKQQLANYAKRLRAIADESPVDVGTY